MLVAFGGWIGWGKRSGSVVDGWGPSWWAMAFVLAGMCLQILFQPQTKHYCFGCWLPDASSPCQPNCPAPPRGQTFLGIDLAHIDSYLHGLRSSRSFKASPGNPGICIFSIFSTKISRKMVLTSEPTTRCYFSFYHS